MHKLSNILWGIVLITLGVVVGMNVLGLTNIDIFFPGWWTLFIIVPCFINLFVDDHKMGNLIGLAIGACLLFACQGWLDMATVWRLIIPFVLVVIGLSLIFHGALGGKAARRIREINSSRRDDETKEYWATFSDQNLNFKGEEFEGCKADSVFGSVKIDLHGAKIKEDALITASCVFGSVVIYVPEDVEVEISTSSLFGGVSDKRQRRQKSKKEREAEKIPEAEVVGEEKSKAKKTHTAKTLYVDATCIFGGLEIK